MAVQGGPPGGEFPALKTQDFLSANEPSAISSPAVGAVRLSAVLGATFVDRMILLLIPLGVVLIPLIGSCPGFTPGATVRSTTPGTVSSRSSKGNCRRTEAGAIRCVSSAA